MSTNDANGDRYDAGPILDAFASGGLMRLAVRESGVHLSANSYGYRALSAWCAWLAERCEMASASEGEYHLADALDDSVLTSGVLRYHFGPLTEGGEPEGEAPDLLFGCLRDEVASAPELTELDPARSALDGTILIRTLKEYVDGPVEALVERVGTPRSFDTSDDETTVTLRYDEWSKCNLEVVVRHGVVESLYLEVV